MKIIKRSELKGGIYRGRMGEIGGYKTLYIRMKVNPKVRDSVRIEADSEAYGMYRYRLSFTTCINTLACLTEGLRHAGKGDLPRVTERGRVSIELTPDSHFSIRVWLPGYGGTTLSRESATLIVRVFKKFLTKKGG